MSKVIRVSDGNFRVVVDNGSNGTITLDTTADSVNPQGTVVVTGNLEVRGTTTTVDSELTTIKDNIITLNNGETGEGISAVFDFKGGIEIDRGSLPTARLVFDESVPYVAGGSSGSGAFRFEDETENFLPVSLNSINAQGDLYVTTPGGTINVAGTVDYEENVFNYEFSQAQGVSIVTDPGDGNVVLNNDGVPNAKGVVDYVTFALANRLQSGVGELDTTLVARDEDLSGVESRIIVEVDGINVANFYSNRLEIADIELIRNEITTTVSNSDLLLSGNGSGSVKVDDVLQLGAVPFDNDPAEVPSVPDEGVKIYSPLAVDSSGAQGQTPGNTGIFFVNSNENNDELVSKNRALLFSMLF